MSFDANPAFDIAVVGTITALNGVLELDPLQKDSQFISITGTWVGTVSFEISADGVTWYAANTANLATGAMVTTTTANGSFLVQSVGANAARVRASAFTSGTIAIANEGSNSVQVSTVVQPNAASLNGRMNLRNSANTEISSSVNDTVSNELILATKTPDTITTTVAFGALNTAVTIPAEGLTGVGFQILAGTLRGTILPEISIDGGATWWPTTFYDATAAAVVVSIVFTANNTARLLTIITLGGTTHARIRVSAYTSGTANTLMSASQGVGVTVTPSGAGGGSAAFSAVTNTTPSTTNNTVTQIIAANSARKYLMISNPSGSLCYISLGSTVGLTTSSGIPIPARSFFELRGDNLFTGAVFAISGSAITFFLGEGTA